MSFNWNEYYELAILLATDKEMSGDNQARFRSAISRCYYAVHNLARDRLIEIDHVRSISSTGEAHRQVIDEYEKHYIEDLQVIGKMLDRLRISRGRADYSDVVKNLRRVTDDALVKTKRIIDLLDENRT